MVYSIKYSKLKKERYYLLLSGAHVTGDDGKRHISWGVVMFYNNARVFSMPDITRDRARLVRLLRLISKNAVPPYQVREILEDCVTEEHIPLPLGS
ncbi:MAG: DUF6514 family protein [Oscillospiraceae bacterium]|jgi:hypothetical protein|nr:DUF6514 family protein [Oscillospiraceae bacterium]